MTVRYNVSLTTGDFSATTAGNSLAGPAIFMGNLAPKVKSLSAKLITLAETNTITLTAKWQVSNDNTNWFDLAYEPQNPAGVVLGTGTAGADVAVTKVIPAPEAVYGWQWARIAIAVGVVNGAAGDTYTLGYAYRQVGGADRG